MGCEPKSLLADALQRCEIYVLQCNVGLAIKTIKHKFFNDLQSLLISIYYWKNLFMDFVTDLFISIDVKRDSYDAIPIIIYCSTKLIYYQLIKFMIEGFYLANIIINVVLRHDRLSKSIINN